MRYFSKTLHKLILTQLKTDILRLEREKSYFEMLSNKHFALEDDSSYQKFSLNRAQADSEKNLKEKNYLVAYIITITFLPANTHINVSDIQGHIKLFFTSGSVNLIGKQKRNRVKAASRLIPLLANKAAFLENHPVAIHLCNVSFKKSFILRKLKKSFFIQLVKSFNQLPFNGCRKRKVRRKKRARKFK